MMLVGAASQLPLRPRVLLPWPSAPLSALWGSVCIRVHSASRTRTPRLKHGRSGMPVVMVQATRKIQYAAVIPAALRAQTAPCSVAPAASSPTGNYRCKDRCEEESHKRHDAETDNSHAACQSAAYRPTVTRRAGGADVKRRSASRSAAGIGSRRLRAMPRPPPDDDEQAYETGLLFAFGYQSDCRVQHARGATHAMHHTHDSACLTPIWSLCVQPPSP